MGAGSAARAVRSAGGRLGAVRALRAAGRRRPPGRGTAATFDRALATFGRYEEQGNAAAWLFAIARHARLDHQRRRRPRIDLGQAGSLVDAEPSPDESALRAETARELRRLVAALPADQQEAVALRFFAGLSTAEAAAALGRSEGAVKMLVHRAVAALRGRYAAQERP